MSLHLFIHLSKQWGVLEATYRLFHEDYTRTPAGNAKWIALRWPATKLALERCALCHSPVCLDHLGEKQQNRGNISFLCVEVVLRLLPPAKMQNKNQKKFCCRQADRCTMHGFMRVTGGTSGLQKLKKGPVKNSSA